MKKRFIPGVLVAAMTAALLALGAPANAASNEPAVTLTSPTANDADFNAIATWNPKKQEACLYSASQLKPPTESKEPWVAPGDCKLWRPAAGTQSGIYVATWDSGKSRALLVNSAEPTTSKGKRILVLVPDYTWQAYDLVKNGNFYFDEVGKKSANFSDRKLNLFRPMNFNTVGDPVNYPAAPQLYPFSNPIHFLRSHLDNVDVVSESNFDEAEYDLGNYRTVVLYGHDEYWTANLKSGLEKAVADGTSLLNLSGNTGYRKLVRTGEVIGFDPTTPEHPRTSRWGDSPNDTTSLKLLGATYLGEPFGKRQLKPVKVSPRMLRDLWRDGLPASVTRRNIHRVLRGMLVRDASNQLFAGTGLKSGDFFGADSKILSIELDGIPEAPNGSIDPEFLAKFGSTPIAALAESWVNARVGASGRAWRAGQLIETTFGKGKVFTAGPIGWTGGLVSGDQTVQRITLNALKYLGEEPLD